MKKLFLVLLFVVALSLCAFAASAEMYQVYDGDAIDFDNDGAADTLNFYIQADEYGDGMFSIAVNGVEYRVTDCVSLAGTAWALPLYPATYYGDSSLQYGTLIMVPSYGMSDDPLTYCFVYDYSGFYYAGWVEALPGNMKYGDDGLIHTYVRAKYIGTWSRPAAFMIASGYKWDGDVVYTTYAITEVPSENYPMGMIVDLTRDISLSAVKGGYDYSVSVPAGQQVVLVSSDDAKWLYVSDLSGNGGWMDFEASDWPVLVNVGGGYAALDEVFGNIFYAD